MTNEEFQQFYEKKYKYFVNLAKKLLKNQQTAEDVVQDVFYKIYKIKDELNFKNEAGLHAYVSKAVRNKAFDYNKKTMDKIEIHGVEEWDEKLETEYDLSAEAVFLGMEKENYIDLAFEKLSRENPVNYDIFVKIRMLDFSPETVANEYGITINNVNNRVMRTSRWLKKHITKNYGD